MIYIMNYRDQNIKQIINGKYNSKTYKNIAKPKGNTITKKSSKVDPAYINSRKIIKTINDNGKNKNKDTDTVSASATSDNNDYEATIKELQHKISVLESEKMKLIASQHKAVQFIKQFIQNIELNTDLDIS
jgi:hypothetical protein